jgi:hypothetical protein
VVKLRPIAVIGIDLALACRGGDEMTRAARASADARRA